MHNEWLALLAALLWAIASLLSVKPASHLGALSFSRWRMGIVTLMLGSAALYTGGFASLHLPQLLLVGASGIVGIFIGDTALYASLNRLGPRRSGLLFSSHALFSALLGAWLFNEQLTGQRLLGAGLVMAGVSIAILFGRRPGSHRLEQIKGPIGIAVLLGLLAGLCQSGGTLLAKPVMSQGVDPVAASCVRMATALVAHLLLRASGWRLARPNNPINWPILGTIAANGFLAMALGMTLVLVALSSGDVGMVAILSSTTPVMLLPLLWIYMRQRPTPSAWLAAGTVVLGTALVLIGRH
jgi:drug/metabolite transporter (DMT)-like permease